MTKQELNYAFDNGILDETQIALDIEMKKKRGTAKGSPLLFGKGRMENGAHIFRSPGVKPDGCSV